mmetsp:Transcript_25080/g.58222  ORF Transcript_25080/g.58222 Transcript_25080/m.58222 type:complete len:230 (+) Transcript_25080:260-949(+)
MIALLKPSKGTRIPSGCFSATRSNFNSKDREPASTPAKVHWDLRRTCLPTRPTDCRTAGALFVGLSKEALVACCCCARSSPAPSSSSSQAAWSCLKLSSDKDLLKALGVLAVESMEICRLLCPDGVSSTPPTAMLDVSSSSRALSLENDTGGPSDFSRLRKAACSCTCRLRVRRKMTVHSWRTPRGPKLSTRSESKMLNIMRAFSSTPPRSSTDVPAISSTNDSRPHLK